MPKLSIIWRLALFSSTACHYCGSVMSQTKKQIKTWILPWLSRARDVSITFFTVVFFAQLLDDIVKYFLFSFFVFRPVNFLHSFSYSNRFTIAATFGATASSCLELFLFSATGGFTSLGVSVWFKGEKCYHSFKIFPTLKHAYLDLCRVSFLITFAFFTAVLDTIAF